LPCRITFAEPDVGCVPDQAPLPLQAVAWLLVQETVALWPGITELGVMEIVTDADGAGCVNEMADVAPPPQPERTRAERTMIRKTKERDFVSAGTCIRPLRA
jgi:hypothetical protein